MKNIASLTAPVPAPDRLLDFRRVNELVGSTCQTSHSARSLARRGLIRAVRLNERVIRYSENSVRRLIAAEQEKGGHAA